MNTISTFIKVLVQPLRYCKYGYIDYRLFPPVVEISQARF